MLQNTNLVSALVSGDGLSAQGENVNLEGFHTARVVELENKNGPLEVNAITSEAPISTTLENGTAHVSLKYSSRDFEIGPENDLQSKNRPLVAEAPLWVDKQMEETVVGLHYDAPFYTSEHGLSLMTDDTTITIDSEGKLKSIDKNFIAPLQQTDTEVRLNIDTPLVVKDGKLTADNKSIMKGAGAIRVYSAMDDILPEMPDWVDIDLPGGLEDYLENGALVKLEVTNDFQQTGSRLAIRSKGLHEIPYYSGLSGFNSSNRFTYNETLQTLTTPTFHAEAVDYNVTEPRQLPTAGYVHQLYQSQAGSAIDISEVANGRKLIKVTHDTTLNINESNQLEVNVPTIADGTSVKAVNGKLTVDPYTAGDGISIANNVVSSTLTYGGSLRREGDQVIGKTVIAGSSNVTVVQTNPFSYEVSVLNPQSQIDNLDDKVTDLNEKTDQNKLETDNEINALKNEDIRLDNKIDAVESRVQQQELKSDLLSNDITTNRGSINNLDIAKNQIQSDLISLGAEVTGLTGVVDTVNTVATGVQVAQALMKGDVTSLQGIATSLAGQVTGLDAALTAYTSLPVVRGVIGIGLIVGPPDPITGIITITNGTGPLMAKEPPLGPTNKNGGTTFKDTYHGDNEGGGGSTGEITPGLPDPPDPPIQPPPPPPVDPVTLKNTGKIGGGGGSGGSGGGGGCLNGVPPIFKNRDSRGERTTFVDSWGKRWSEEIQSEFTEEGIERSILEYDDNGVPIVTPGHLDIILRRDDDNNISTAILTHDRHLQTGYINQGGILSEHPSTVPNLAMIYQAYESYILPYIESINYVNVGQGLVKTGNTLSLNDDLTTFAKTSSLKALAFKDTLAYNDLTGRPTLGTLAAKNSIAWTEVTSRPALGTLSSKNTIDWTGTDILNKPTDLTTKTYVDSLSYLTVGAGLVKTGSTISLGSDLGAFEVKTNLKALAYKDSLSWTEITSKPTLGTLASKSSVSWTTEVANKPTLGTLSTKNNIDYNSTDIINKPDLSIYETKTSLKGLAYKDKVDYVADLLNAPASVTYGSGLLFSNNTVSLNPAVSVDTLTTTSGISVGANVYATGNVDIGGAFYANRSINGAFNHILNNQSSASTSCTSLHLKAGSLQGLYLHINSAARGSYGGVNTATIQNYAGALRLLTKTETGGIIVDTSGSVTIPTTLSVGALNLGTLTASGSISVGGSINVSGGSGTVTDIVSFPPANMTAETTLITGQTYGNGTYVATASSIYNNSTYYTPWRAFETGPWYPLVNSYSATAPYSYVRGITTLVDSVSVAGEWIQLQMPVSIILSSFDITSSTTSRFIKDFDLVGSDDNGATFTNILSSTMNWGTGSAQTLNIPVPKSAKAFNTYRLIVKSMAGSSTFCSVNKLVFNGLPALDIKGTISTNRIITKDFVCEGDVQMNGMTLQEEIVSTMTFPEIPMTAATTGQYTATSSSVYSASWTPWKIYNPYDSSNNNTWFAADNTYSTTTPFSYIGSVSTVVDGQTVMGEWIQLEMQTAIALTSFYIAGPTSASSQYFDIKDFMIAASNNNSTWKQVVQGTLDWSSAMTNGSLRELNVVITTNPPVYKSYRLIAKSIIGGSNAKYAQIYSLKYSGGPLKKVLNVENLKVNKIFGDLSIDNDVSFKNDIVDPIRYPQIPLTGSTTAGYIANASSYLNGTSAGWKAFTNSLEINDSYWSASTYSGGEQNMYQGTVITVVDGSNIKGEWVELEMPEAIAINAFSFAARTPEMPMFPKNYTICGSDDHSTWTEISSGTMTYTIYQNSTSVDRYVPIKNYTTKKFKVFRFIVRNLISSTYAHIGKLTFYGSNTTRKIIDAPSAKINNMALTAPAYGMFQLHSSQAFSVNGTAYQLITKWTPSFGMESDTITCSTNSQDIVIKLPGIYKVEFDLDCHQSGSGSVNSYFGFMVPGSTVYYEDGYHVRKHSMVAGQKVTGSSICRVVEADTKMILRFISASSSGGITGSQASRLIIYRIAPLA
ncbi:hypothetical protein BC832DRAFT_591503 [Gaertneriomyces semiglobifer]|nr:hypothetical protein BC832DRAFT_591503 [Gaertneriomyces semiglobifer]